MSQYDWEGVRENWPSSRLQGSGWRDLRQAARRIRHRRMNLDSRRSRLPRPATPLLWSNDPGCARRSHAPNRRRIQVMRDRIDVREHRRNMLPMQCMSGGDKCVRRDNYLALHSQSANRDFQRNRAVADGDAVTNTQVLGDALLNSRTNGPSLLSQPRSNISPASRRKVSRPPVLGRPTCSGVENAGEVLSGRSTISTSLTHQTQNTPPANRRGVLCLRLFRRTTSTRTACAAWDSECREFRHRGCHSERSGWHWRG